MLLVNVLVTTKLPFCYCSDTSPNNPSPCDCTLFEVKEWGYNVHHIAYTSILNNFLYLLIALPFHSTFYSLSQWVYWLEGALSTHLGIQSRELGILSSQQIGSVYHTRTVRHVGGGGAIVLRLNFPINPRKRSIFYRSFSKWSTRYKSKSLANLCYNAVSKHLTAP